MGEQSIRWRARLLFRDLDRLKKEVGQKPHKVQEKKMHSPTFEMEQSQAPVQAGNNWLESSFEEKDLSILVDSKFSICLHGVLAAKGNSRSMEENITLCSVLVTPHLEQCPVLGSHYKT